MLLNIQNSTIRQSTKPTYNNYTTPAYPITMGSNTETTYRKLHQNPLPIFSTILKNSVISFLPNIFFHTLLFGIQESYNFYFI